MPSIHPFTLDPRFVELTSALRQRYPEAVEDLMADLAPHDPVSRQAARVTLAAMARKFAREGNGPDSEIAARAAILL